MGERLKQSTECEGFAVFSCRRSFTYVNSSYAPKEMATPGILKP